jgi:multisubunit Na+/H+ antiporter MnhE subunit
MTLRAGPWALWFLACFWLWMLLVGDWNPIEWVAGACVAAVSATIAESIRRRARVELRLSVDVFRSSALVLPMVFVDFAIVTVALARSLVSGHVVTGRYITRRFDPGARTTPRGAARRAWTVLLAGYSPNAYVVDIDVEHETVLLHDLVPHRRSEEPA